MSDRLRHRRPHAPRALPAAVRAGRAGGRGARDHDRLQPAQRQPTARSTSSCSGSCVTTGASTASWSPTGTPAARPVGGGRGGLDLQMPGPARFYGEAPGQPPSATVDVDEAALDDIVTRLLTVFDRLGALDDDPAQQPIAVDRPEHRALARRAAIESMVLLKNDGVLPFDPTTIRTLAVIGPNAEWARTGGGGSAEVAPPPPHAAAGGDRRPSRRRRDHPPRAGLHDRPHGAGHPDRASSSRRPARPASRSRSSPARRSASTSAARRASRPSSPARPTGGCWWSRSTRPPSRRARSRSAPAPASRPMPAVPTTSRSCRPVRRGCCSTAAVVLDGVTDPPRRGREFFGMGSEELRATVALARRAWVTTSSSSTCSSERAWVHGDADRLPGGAADRPHRPRRRGRRASRRGDRHRRHERQLGVGGLRPRRPRPARRAGRADRAGRGRQPAHGGRAERRRARCPPVGRRPRPPCSRRGSAVRRWRGRCATCCSATQIPAGGCRRPSRCGSRTPRRSGTTPASTVRCATARACSSATGGTTRAASPPPSRSATGCRTRSSSGARRGCRRPPSPPATPSRSTST